MQYISVLYLGNMHSLVGKDKQHRFLDALNKYKFY